MLRLSSAEATLARQAALVRRLRRFGVPASVWDRPGPLNQHNRERMRMHVYYVERIFTRPEPLRRIGLLAAAHHERMDGSGYHRGVDGTMLSVAARLLAAARLVPRDDTATASSQRAERRGGCRPAAARCRARDDWTPWRWTQSWKWRPWREPVTSGRAGGPDGPRERCSRAARPGATEQGDRPPARHQPENRWQPRGAHLHQTRCVQPGGGRHARHAVRAHGQSGHSEGDDSRASIGTMGRPKSAASGGSPLYTADTGGWRLSIEPPSLPLTCSFLSGGRDLNSRPPDPQSGALPNCATARAWCDSRG